MGLDSNLWRVHFTGYCREDIYDFKGRLAHIDSRKVVYVFEEACYWRKNWLVHEWFTRNAQAGQDNNTMFFMTRDDLVRFVDIAKKVLARETWQYACRHLPTKHGYGDGYFYDVDQAIMRIEDELLREPQCSRYCYRGDY